MRIYKPLSDETKAKISEKMKGKPKSKSHRKALSESHTGILYTDERNMKIGASVSKTAREKKPRIYIDKNEYPSKRSPIIRVKISKKNSYLDLCNIKNEDLESHIRNWVDTVEHLIPSEDTFC